MSAEQKEEEKTKTGIAALPEDYQYLSHNTKLPP